MFCCLPVVNVNKTQTKVSIVFLFLRVLDTLFKHFTKLIFSLNELEFSCHKKRRHYTRLLYFGDDKFHQINAVN